MHQIARGLVTSVAMLTAMGGLGCCTRTPLGVAGPQDGSTPVQPGIAAANGQPVPGGQVVQGAYEIGTPVLADIWVDPVRGNDTNTGSDPAHALRTITAAWQKVPSGKPLSGTGWRINLLPGTYPCEPGPEDANCINYFDQRHGTREFPVILRAANGRGTATVRGGFNFKDVSYLYVLDVTAVGGGPLPTNSSGNNLVHVEAGDHLLFRGVTLTGPECVADTCNNLQEVLKANQAQHLYVEDSTIGGAWHSAVDWMVVQHGHVLNSHLRGAGQWCMYAKGGSAYLRIEGNELEGCQLGFQAGQAANFAMMQSPWLHYEAYYVKVTNNVIHDIPGVPLSVAGGYDVLFAHNTLYRVATSPTGYPLIQVVHGERNCTPTDEVPNPVPACKARGSEGGWGPGFQTDGAAVIPSRNVWVYNNIFWNPAPLQTSYSHFAVEAPASLPLGFMNLPTVVPVDTNLVFAGNVVWNGPASHPLGFEESASGCRPGNPTCSPDGVLRDNSINAFEPLLVDPSGGDYRPAPNGRLASIHALPIPAFPPSDALARPFVPAGQLSNAVPSTRDGKSRANESRPGAY